MRRIIGLILIGLGMFLLVLAPLARFYAYPRLAVAPYDQNTLTVLDGPNATVFDIASLKEIKTDLTTTAKTIGDISGSEKAPEGDTVWVTTSSTKDSNGTVRSRSIERAAFDQYTAEAVNCCNEFLETTEGEPTPVRHEGLVFKFPFNTGKQTYQWWDSTLRKAVPVEFDRVEDVKGTTTYKFSQTIEPTVVGTAQVPASLVGGTGTEPVTAQRVYSNERSMWVEPRTGVIFDRVEKQNSTLRYQGVDAITTTRVETSYSDATINDRIDEYVPLGDQLNLVRNVVPLAALIVGLLLLVVGLVLLLTGSRRPPEEEAVEGAPEDEPSPAAVP